MVQICMSAKNENAEKKEQGRLGFSGREIPKIQHTLVYRRIDGKERTEDSSERPHCRSCSLSPSHNGGSW